LDSEGAKIAFKIPPVSKSGEGALMESTLIYDLKNKPTPQCHASTIAETPSGLVCAFFAGKDEGNKDVGIRLSRLEEGKWSWPEEIVNGIQSENLRYPCWNPVLFQVPQGSLLLFYKVGPNPRAWWGMLSTSDDHGKSWSTPQKLGMEDKIGHLIGPVKNKPLLLNDGSILCPSSTEMESKAHGTQWKVHFELTRDLGKTWEVIGPINDGINFDAIQPSILSYPDGKMQILCRSRQDVITQSWSEDGGHTWSKMMPTMLPNPSAGTDAVTLKDGRQLLVYNHTTRKGKTSSGRYLLNVAISKDGNDWEPVLTLENDTTNNAGFSYPAVIQSKDGMVHITYTYIRESIKYVVLDPVKL
jgi:predicted neuraminidase